MNKYQKITIGNGEEVHYASFSLRLVAFLADLALLCFVLIIFPVGLISNWDIVEIVKVLKSLKPIASFNYGLVLTLNLFLLPTWSKTPGKALLGLKVLNERSGRRINLVTAIGRTIFQGFSLLFGLGYWSMKSSEKKQAFHDKKAHTVVIVERETSKAWQSLVTITVGVFWALMLVLSLI